MKGRQFHGHEALATVALDPPRRLVGLRVEGNDVPEAGAPIQRDGREIGVVTSPTASPTFGPIALAVVETPSAESGRVEVAVGDAWVAARQGGPSIHDPDKRRLRS